MCGIVGWISKERSVDPLLCHRSLISLKHRGPDCQRALFWNPGKLCIENLGDKIELDTYRAFLGHVRLSILDLNSNAHQPYSFERRYWLVYNGEVYNFREIRLDLEKRGFHFETDCDTEVVLKALIEFGPAAIELFNGMWSFAFFDMHSQSVLLSRDRYGKKPLFYSYSNKGFVFGSEFKAIFAILGEDQRRMNPDFARHFVNSGEWGRIEDKNSCYEGVESLIPGSVYQLHFHDFSFHKVYHSPIVFETENSPEPNEEELPSLIASSVRLRARADVPVGVLVSGGIDSSVVAGHLYESGGNNTTWFAGNTGHGNDVYYSKIMAKSFGHPLEVVDVFQDNQILDTMKEMSYFYEIPVWLLGNSIGVYLMYRAMKKRGVKVVLDGTGGDEVFGGYYNFYAESVIDDCVSRRKIAEALLFIKNCHKYQHFSAHRLLKRLKASWKNRHNLAAHPLIECQIKDIKTGHLPSWLYMNDQNSMAHSMEARSPLLDARLARFISLKSTQKFYNGFNKVALRAAMPTKIPSSVRWRRDKQGFRWLPNDIVANNFQAMNTVIRQSDYITEIFPNYAKLNDVSECTDPGLFLRLYAVALLDSVNLSRRKSV